MSDNADDIALGSDTWEPNQFMTTHTGGRSEVAREI
jgi:hypothetical protein